jgi:hypothetical protein
MQNLKRRERHVAVDLDLDDLLGREEAVADALLERIGECPSSKSLRQMAF